MISCKKPPAPFISEVSPEKVCPGTLIQIRGENLNFHDELLFNDVSIGIDEYNIISEEIIALYLPPEFQQGEIEVYFAYEEGESNRHPILIECFPRIDDVIGCIESGLLLTIMGRDFSSSSEVFFISGDQQLAEGLVSSWTLNSLIVEVPQLAMINESIEMIVTDGFENSDTMVVSSLPPIFSEFDTQAGRVGDTIDFSGNFFGENLNIHIPSVGPGDFVIVTEVSLNADMDLATIEIPQGAISGSWTIKNNCGMVDSDPFVLLPKSTKIHPFCAFAGDTVIISGSNLGDQNSKVLFDSVEAQVLFGQYDTLRVIVPEQNTSNDEVQVFIQTEDGISQGVNFEYKELGKVSIQFINVIPDSNSDAIDIFINDTMNVNKLEYKSGSDLLEIPKSFSLEIAESGSDNKKPLTLSTLNDSFSYVIALSGLFSSSQSTTAIRATELIVESVNQDSLDFCFFNGVTDVGQLNIKDGCNVPLVEKVGFGEFAPIDITSTSYFFNVDPSDLENGYRFLVKPSGVDVLKTFSPNMESFKTDLPYTLFLGGFENPAIVGDSLVLCAVAFENKASETLCLETSNWPPTINSLIPDDSILPCEILTVITDIPVFGCDDISENLSASFTVDGVQYEFVSLDVKDNYAIELLLPSELTPGETIEMIEIYISQNDINVEEYVNIEIEHPLSFDILPSNQNPGGFLLITGDNLSNVASIEFGGASSVKVDVGISQMDEAQRVNDSLIVTNVPEEPHMIPGDSITICLLDAAGCQLARKTFESGLTSQTIGGNGGHGVTIPNLPGISLLGTVSATDWYFSELDNENYYQIFMNESNTTFNESSILHPTGPFGEECNSLSGTFNNLGGEIWLSFVSPSGACIDYFGQLDTTYGISFNNSDNNNFYPIRIILFPLREGPQAEIISPYILDSLSSTSGEAGAELKIYGRYFPIDQYEFPKILFCPEGSSSFETPPCYEVTSSVNGSDGYSLAFDVPDNIEVGKYEIVLQSIFNSYSNNNLIFEIVE